MRYLILFFFFFSSRRRHTRFKCDWSSDVCSSDLFSGGTSLLFCDANMLIRRCSMGKGGEQGAAGDHKGRCWRMKERVQRGRAGASPNTFQIRAIGIASANCLEPCGRTSTSTKSPKRPSCPNGSGGGG